MYRDLRCQGIWAPNTSILTYNFHSKWIKSEKKCGSRWKLWVSLRMASGVTKHCCSPLPRCKFQIVGERKGATSWNVWKVGVTLKILTWILVAARKRLRLAKGTIGEGKQTRFSSDSAFDIVIEIVGVSSPEPGPAWVLQGPAKKVLQGYYKAFTTREMNKTLRGRGRVQKQKSGYHGGWG